ncbi:MAG: Lrp/AsnC ligand binding domain-containing protein [Desulfosarcinaceae bacterium]|nr:Lrp/AsnC ligand binding domain-containing protein [Desulfosarcinaceae bacterium]
MVDKLIERYSTYRRNSREAGQAKCFDDRQRSEAAFDAKDRGTRRVPLEEITGSVGRYQDFDRQFRPKSHMPSDRLEQIRAAMKRGKRMPPVKLYQIKDEYYVVDGHHRVAVARELGLTEIAGRVIEFMPSADTLENALYCERAAFAEVTGLAEKIILTELGHYPYLIRQIRDHQRYLRRESDAQWTLAEAARDWYDTIYTPMAALIEKGNLLTSFPERTMADLYTYMAFHQWELGRRRRYGLGIDELIPKSMEAFRTKMAGKKRSDYPEMLRGIVAFILMHVEARHEERLIEKLYALPEVTEVHAVHGAVDMLVKIQLTRDLLTSDAEVIGHFISDKVRRINGVRSTQTLIPGISRVKPVAPPA